MQAEVRKNMGIIEQYAFVLFVYTLIVISHELGHWLTLRAFGIKKVSWVKGKWFIGVSYWSSLSNKKKQMVLLAGIFTGLLPFVLLNHYHIIVVLLLGGLYFDMCMCDVRRLKKLGFKLDLDRN